MPGLLAAAATIQIQILNFKNIIFQLVGKQGVGWQKSLSLNLKGRKLFKLENQGVGCREAKEFEFEFYCIKMEQNGGKGEGRHIFSDFY